MGPTPRQLQILKHIQAQIARNGYAPSIQEICDCFKLASTATVHKHLKNLVERGLIVRSEHRSRAISVRGSVRLAEDARAGAIIDTDTGEVIA